MLDGAEGGPWTVGRAPQRELFELLVPDEQQRALISRRHFELAREGSEFAVTTFSNNVLLVDGSTAPYQQSMRLVAGAHLGLCGLDAMTPLLVFRLQPGGGQCERRQPAAAAAESPAAKAPRPGQAFQLACTLAFGCDSSGLCEEAKPLPVQATERLLVGRAHQLGFFEGLLGRRQQLLSFVSRTHFELAPVPGAPAGVFELTNMSGNPLGIDHHKLAKGESMQVRAPQRIDFLGCLPGQGEAGVFLCLSLVASGSPPLAGPPKTIFGLQG